jgi:MoaA/NifB/PqqE/SkfB family radical SAM enzyme
MLRKTLNYKLVELQKRMGVSTVLGYPYWLTIDPCSACNLECPCCPTGLRKNVRPRVMLPFAGYRKIVDVLGPYLIHVDFCNWGEPLLNRDVPEMIAYAQRFGCTTRLDSSFNVELTDDLAGRLVRSGLSRLVVSLDGASQAAYEMYRRNGRFDTVVANVRRLVAKKKELHRTLPRIHWQFLVFKHNEHEIGKALEMARQIGVDSIGFVAPYCPVEMASSIDRYNRYVIKDDRVAYKETMVEDRCGWLWDSIAVNADGSVSPCCSVEDRKDDFADFFSKPFWRLWNSRNYRTARARVRTGKRSAGNVCTRCDHAGVSNHFPVWPVKADEEAVRAPYFRALDEKAHIILK